MMTRSVFIQKLIDQQFLLYFRLMSVIFSTLVGFISYNTDYLLLLFYNIILYEAFD